MADTFTIIDNRTGKSVEVPIVDGGISSKALASSTRACGSTTGLHADGVVPLGDHLHRR